MQHKKYWNNGNDDDVDDDDDVEMNCLVEQQMLGWSKTVTYVRCGSRHLIWGNGTKAETWRSSESEMT